MELLVKVAFIAGLIHGCLAAGCENAEALECSSFDFGPEVWSNREADIQLAGRTEDCSFEGMNNCTLINENVTRVGDILWEIQSGDSGQLGPPVDHTYGTPAGKYAVASLRGGIPGSSAVLVSNPFTVVTCLTFYYYVSGSDVGALTVGLECAGVTAKPIFIIPPDDSIKGAWAVASVTAYDARASPGDEFEVFFMSYFNGEDGFWALDDISITEGSCEDNSRMCYPDKTREPDLKGPVVVANPSPSMFRHALSYDDVTKVKCDTTFSDDNNWVTIDGDCKIRNVIIAFHNDTDGLTNIIGGDVIVMHAYEICEVSGGYSTLTETSFVLVEESSLTESHVEVYADMSMRLVSETGTVTLTGLLTQPIIWTFDIPAKYSGVLEVCRAYPGTSTQLQNRAVPLITKGCTTSNDMTLSFSPGQFTIVGSNKRYFTTFYPFKFYDHEFITIACVVRICRISTSACNFTCPAVGKRSVEDTEVADLLDSRVTSFVTLKVVDPMLGLMASASGLSATVSLAVLAVALLRLG